MKSEKSDFEANLKNAAFNNRWKRVRLWDTKKKKPAKMKRINLLICFAVLSSADADPVNPSVPLNSSDLETAKADVPYVPYSQINHNSTYDEEQVREAFCLLHFRCHVWNVQTRFGSRMSRRRWMKLPLTDCILNYRILMPDSSRLPKDTNLYAQSYSASQNNAWFTVAVGHSDYLTGLGCRK